MDAELRARQLLRYKNGEADVLSNSRFSSLEELEGEWAQRVHKPFPGYDTQGAQIAIALAGIARENAAWLYLGEIYEIAIDKCAKSESANVHLSPAEQDIVNVICEAGKPLSQTEIFDSLSAKGKIPSEGTTKTTLAALVRHGILKTGPGGKGYIPV